MDVPPISGSPDIAPESATGFTEKVLVRASRAMIATANPLATEAGYDILQQGGSAVDAAIAAQMVLGLTEPQSSGIGGGALLLLYDGMQVVAFDGRETAPAAATPDRFLDTQGKPLALRDAVVGGALSACQACSRCSTWRISNTASCHGPRSSNRPFAWRRRAFQSRAACICSGVRPASAPR